jgi:hypothetical protein
VREFWASHGLISDPGAHRGLLDGLPRDLPGLAGVVQGLLVHVDWAHAYGVEVDRSRDAQLRSVKAILERVVRYDDAPLGRARAPKLRFAGVCRDFATLSVAMLRRQRVPARARCGFATYFAPGAYVDHWVCESWREDLGRWARADTQIDALQRSALGIDFDPLDVPHDRFLDAALAWQLCRRGEIDPKRCGIRVPGTPPLELSGLWFVAGNLLRDVASLCRMEMLAWDGWGLMRQDDAFAVADLALLDRAAELVQAGDAAFDELRSLYARDARLRVPDQVLNYMTGARERVRREVA